jgi:SAM-dependent methyltransferase
MTGDIWAGGDAYEAYMGRWGRRVAALFLSWLDAPARWRWLDVGCGTGALTASVLTACDPAEVTGIDSSGGFISHARAHITDQRSHFAVGDARALPFPDGRFDAVVSGLVLNFLPVPSRAAAELARVVVPGGRVAAYVWDYAGGMAMLRYFWEAAAALDPAAAFLDEGRRFPLCRPEPLRELWIGAGLNDVTVEPIEAPTVFAAFDDFWVPFLGGQGPAPGYAMSLTGDARAALRDLLRDRLPTQADGSIALTARAWAVSGRA